jgi:hypothetical protein
MKKYLIVIEKVQRELNEAEFEADTTMEVLDAARQLIATKNKNSTHGTIFSIKSVKEISNE